MPAFTPTAPRRNKRAAHSASRRGTAKVAPKVLPSARRTLKPSKTAARPAAQRRLPAVIASPSKKPRSEPAKAPRWAAPKTKAGSEPVHYVEPMKALGVAEISGDGWLLEIKYDGYRALGIKEGGRAELWSRNEKPLTESYPEIAQALAKLPCEDVIIDGEIVALDAEGRPTFQLLQGRDIGEERPPIYYYVFDLLHRDGRSLLQEPIEVRKAELERLMKAVPDPIRLSAVFEQTPDVLLEAVRKQGLEGIIGKRRGSFYEPGRRSGAWAKKRISVDQEFVIGGYTPPRGGRTHFGALLVGFYEGETLMYAGKVGTGFNSKLLASLHQRFKKLESPTCPFGNLPTKRPRFGLGMTASAMREVTWLRPELVAQIRFSEWTRDAMLRQPVFLGLREDKRAREVVREGTFSAGE